jgi:hypothetical protein
MPANEPVIIGADGDAGGQNNRSAYGRIIAQGIDARKPPAAPSGTIHGNSLRLLAESGAAVALACIQDLAGAQSPALPRRREPCHADGGRVPQIRLHPGLRVGGPRAAPVGLARPVASQAHVRRAASMVRRDRFDASGTVAGQAHVRRATGMVHQQCRRRAGRAG